MNPFFRYIFFFAFLALPLAGAAPANNSGVGFEQRLGETLPADAIFHDTEGHTGPLKTWLGGRPVVLWFGYARCAQLCSVAGDAMVTGLRQLEATAGRDFDVVMISIDPAESPADAQAARTVAVGRYGRTGAESGWHYLTGDSAAIGAVTEAAGFHFAFIPHSQQYVHPSGLLVLTPQGRISGYVLGVDFPAKDLAAALDRAKHGSIGERVADLLLTCFRGDRVGGRYGTIIWRTLGLAVVFTVLLLAGGIGRMLWQEFRPPQKPAS